MVAELPVVYFKTRHRATGSTLPTGAMQSLLAQTSYDKGAFHGETVPA
jgi:hypothetical protein